MVNKPIWFAEGDGMGKIQERLRDWIEPMFENEKRRDFERAAEALDACEAALRTIAALNDEGANFHLKHTGSYGAFDEPGSVQIAREALSKLLGDAK